MKKTRIMALILVTGGVLLNSIDKVLSMKQLNDTIDIEMTQKSVLISWIQIWIKEIFYILGLRKSNLTEKENHFAIFLKKSLALNMIMTLNDLRKSGIGIVDVNTIVQYLIHYRLYAANYTERCDTKDDRSNTGIMQWSSFIHMV